MVAGGGKVFWPSGSADIGLAGRATLQAPSTDGKQQSWVAVSTPRGISIIDLHSKKAVPLPSSGKGDAAQPVSTGGCVFAAWAQRANNYVTVCDAGGSGAKFMSLQAVNPTSQLVFRTNHRLVVLNDVINGNVWNPQESTKVIKIQWNKVQTQQTKQQDQSTDSANNQHVDNRYLTSPLFQAVNSNAAIHRRACIRHTSHAGKAASRCGAAAGFKVFFCFLPRFA